MYNKYEYLFPFDKVPSKTKIVIYGAGDLGQEYLKQIFLINYCKVIGMIDRDFERYSFLNVPVYAPENVLELDYSYVVIALMKYRNIDAVKKKLLSMGVSESKIIYTGRYENFPNIESRCYSNVKCDSDNQITVSFNLYRCGYGDAIIGKKIIERLLVLTERIQIDIYSSRVIATYLHHIYEKNDRVKIVSPYKTSITYEESMDRYMLSMQLGYSLRLDNFDKSSIEKIDRNFALKMESLRDELIKYNKMSFFEQMMLAKYTGRNAYTVAYYQDVLGIDDMYVNIPFKSDVYYKIGLPIRYITIDLSDEDGERKKSKLWPRYYAEKFTKMFKEKYRNIDIVQIGSSDADLLNEVKGMLGLDFEYVKYIIKNSILHIGPEGGTVHLASQLGTKCAVLFGGTPIWYYGYSNNINISTNVCEPCYCLLPNIYECARKMEKPECMYSITPELVMDRIKVYLENEL